MSNQNLFCTFHVGGQYYGVPVSDVQEVLSSHYITGMPLAPPAILGLMNIRGQIVPAVAMRIILGLQDETDLQSSMNVVVRHDGAEVSLLVDRIDDVIEIRSDCIESPPDTLDRSLRKFIHGVAQLPDSLLLLLNVHAVLADERCGQTGLNQSGHDMATH